MGVNNFGFAVLNNSKQIDGGFIENTITTLIHPYFLKERRRFIKTMIEFFEKHRPKYIVMERYQNRGRFRGKGIELINIMIGVIIDIAYRLKIKPILITASQWKNNFAKTFDLHLNELYNEFKPVPNHLIDAHLQAWYWINHDYQFAFDNWKATRLRYLKKWHGAKRKSKSR